jgi:hypothetical protein
MNDRKIARLLVKEKEHLIAALSDYVALYGHCPQHIVYSEFIAFIDVRSPNFLNSLTFKGDESESIWLEFQNEYYLNNVLRMIVS